MSEELIMRSNAATGDAFQIISCLCVMNFFIPLGKAKAQCVVVGDPRVSQSEPYWPKQEWSKNVLTFQPRMWGPIICVLHWFDDQSQPLSFFVESGKLLNAVFNPGSSDVVLGKPWQISGNLALNSRWSLVAQECLGPSWIYFHFLFALIDWSKGYLVFVSILA